MERNIPRSSLYILLVIGSAVLVQDSVRNALICYLGKLWKDCGNTMQEMWSNFLELVNISIKKHLFKYMHWLLRITKIFYICENIPYFFVIFETGDDDYLLTTIGLMVLLHLLFYGVGSIYIVMDVTNKPQFLRKYKIQPGTNEPVDFSKLKKLFR